MKIISIKIVLGIILISFIFNSCFKDELLKEIDDLRGQLTSIQKRNDSLNSVLNVRADSLSKALASAQKRSDSLSNVLKTKSDSLSNALGLTNANLATLTKSVDSIKTQIATINGQLTQLNTQLTSITTQLTQLNQQLGALGGDVSKLATQYQTLSVSLQTINTQITALQAEQLKLLEQLNTILLQLNPPIDITTGLVAYYPFNGNAIDSSGNSNNGTVIGAVSSENRFGQVGRSLFFSNLNDRVTVNNATPLINSNSPFTLSTWIKIPQQWKYSTLTILGNGTQYIDGFHLVIDQNDLYGFNNYQIIMLKANSTSRYLTNQSQISNWFHVCISYDGNQTKLFINSSLVVVNNDQLNFNTTNGNLLIGAWTNQTPPNVFGRYIDDIRIYNRALTQDEIIYLSKN